jgi:hypothetical protein
MHPFFSEVEAEQHILTFHREAERAAQQAHDVAEERPSHHVWTIRQTGLAAFGVGLLMGCFLVRIIGPVPIVVMAGCVSMMVTLPVLIRSLTLLKRKMGAKRAQGPASEVF